MQGLVYQRGQSKPFIVNLIISSDIVTYQNHRYTKGVFEEDYTAFGYVPQKYDIFLPQQGIAWGMSFLYYNTDLIKYAPLIIEDVNNGVYTFKQVFDLDIPIIMSGTFTFTQMLQAVLQMGMETVFGGIFDIGTPVVLGYADVMKRSYSYSQVSNTTIGAVWQTINTNSSNSLSVYFHLDYVNGQMIATIEVGDLSRELVTLSLGSSQLLEVTQTTNFDSSSSVNVVGGYLEDGTIYKYCYLDASGKAQISSSLPFNESTTPMIVTYTQIDSADDSTLLSSSIQSLTRTLNNSPIDISLKISLLDVIASSINLGSFIYITDYGDAVQQMALREFDFKNKLAIIGDNSNLTLVS